MIDLNATWPPLVSSQPVVLSAENYERARLCVNACRGVPDEWLEAYVDPQLEMLFGQGMPIDVAMRHWIQRAARAEARLAELQATLQTALLTCK